MALNVPGVIAVVVFYILILATGIWAGHKARKAEKKSHGGQAEVVLLGDRSISLLVGIFTMTGTLPSGIWHILCAPFLLIKQKHFFYF